MNLIIILKVGLAFCTSFFISFIVLYKSTCPHRIGKQSWPLLKNLEKPSFKAQGLAHSRCSRNQASRLYSRHKRLSLGSKTRSPEMWGSLGREAWNGDPGTRATRGCPYSAAESLPRRALAVRVLMQRPSRARRCLGDEAWRQGDCRALKSQFSKIPECSKVRHTGSE